MAASEGGMSIYLQYHNYDQEGILRSAFTHELATFEKRLGIKSF